jgi:hypothetical protein
MLDDLSIFRKYYQDEPFLDRYEMQKGDAVDVIIPVMHTNELWEANLRSIYREVPVSRLLISDGGCVDNSIDIVKKFPRVVVYDHKKFVSLGYCLRKLIEAVETEWFVYFHSDVYLPKGWFDAMQKHQAEYDWFGCPMQTTFLVEYNEDYHARPWAGSQMGRKKAFESGLSKIDDDYVYRQEDFVLASIVKKAGYKEGKVTDTLHYHQMMHKPTPWGRKVRSMAVVMELSREEELRTLTTQLKGTIKYLDPSIPWAVVVVRESLFGLLQKDQLDWNGLRRWVRDVNPVWLPYISRRRLLKKQLEVFLRAVYSAVFK